LNHCPVYTRIGGHAYGFVYPGPIGKILTPQVEGLEKAGDLPFASTLCGACEEVCPVKIPIVGLLRRLRDESYARAPQGVVPGRGCKQNVPERLAWKGWAFLNSHPRLNRTLTALLRMVGGYLPSAGPLERWMRYRMEPQFAAKGLHRRVREEDIADE
jgi:L-lactate dehydrogenase complex protein LldF